MNRCTLPPVGMAADQARFAQAGVPVLRTDRLTLRAARMEDLPVWTRLMAEDDQGFMGGPFGAEDAYAAFCVHIAGWHLQGHGLWSVERTKDGTLLGFTHIGLEWGDAEPELGWMILPEFRRRGYAKEAAEAARDYGTGLFGPGGVVSYVAQDNAASRRLAESLGAVRDPEAECGIGYDCTVWRHGSAA